MNTNEATLSTRVKVGLFTLLGLFMIGAITVYVNDKPFWWRKCQLVRINIEDATGLKSKSPVRSLGLEIGYLKTVDLYESHVSLGICVTAPVEILPSTRAFIRAEGFLGDKFVELKPVRYKEQHSWNFDLIPSAHAQEPGNAGAGREIPVGQGSQDMSQVVNKVNDLVSEVSGLATNLKQAIDPEDLRKTMKELNRTLENASKTFSPEGGLNKTAQRSLAKLEDAIEQLRDMLTRVNKGEGSVGMLLNDPSYAEDIREAIKNVNKLLSKVGNVRFIVDVGGEHMGAYDGGRAWFRLGIWPKVDRYYLLGISVDPRGQRTASTTKTTTIAGGTTTTTEQDRVQVESTGILFTGMLGKVFYRRLDLSLGVLNGDGTVSAKFNFGPRDREDAVQLFNEVYSRGGDTGVQDRIGLVWRPWSVLYVKGGMESLGKVDGKIAYFYGAGISFEDEDIKLLFALR